MPRLTSVDGANAPSVFCYEPRFRRIRFWDGGVDMEEKVRRRGFAEKMAQVFDLPADAVAGLPLIELIGDKQLRVENHRGILAYDPREIHIGGGKVAIRVKGLELELKVMNAGELLIMGQIFSVSLE